MKKRTLSAETGFELFNALRLDLKKIGLSAQTGFELFGALRLDLKKLDYLLRLILNLKVVWKGSSEVGVGVAQKGSKVPLHVL